MTPALLKTSTPSIIRSAWRLSAARWIITPIPSVAIECSTTKIEISARPSPRRRPVMMNGTVDGVTTDRKSRRGGALKLRAPLSAGMMIEKNAARKTIAIFDPTPRPRMISTIGISATGGNALKKFSQRSRTNCSRRNQPAASPIGTAVAMARAVPAASSVADAETSLQKRSSWTSRVAAAAIAVG